MNMTISYSRLQKDLKWTCDKVCHEREPILVERRKGENIILISEKDYTSLMETAYLMRSSANAQRLIEALHRPRSEQMEFKDTHELKNAIDL
uniref:Antitoxin n=1 Tax=Candidatus Kentrum sp. MB TaxID=2138164 RepID=A0A451BF65_9GAMM|nr:MAG: antitoxin YefM [Candidatus Kentron sp. MB]VFK34744.1 MAG: antitoxin YefM [Candidatus Kentron sp. MB]VFK76919.1 MAG: antitoxin YefM [Candidatus Kentron sp. MB]